MNLKSKRKSCDSLFRSRHFQYPEGISRDYPRIGIILNSRNIVLKTGILNRVENIKHKGMIKSN